MSREPINTKNHLNKVEKFVTITQQHSRNILDTVTFPYIVPIFNNPIPCGTMS